MSDDIVVTVTQDDIDNGVKCTSGKCPLARAFYRLFSFADYEVYAYQSRVMVGRRVDNAVIWLFPVTSDADRVSRFVDNFDTGAAVSPSVFTYSEDRSKS